MSEPWPVGLLLLYKLVSLCFVDVTNFYWQELETVTNQCEQLQSEKDETTKKLHKVESSYRKMEKEKNELIQVKKNL